jgi:hypothetical protein
MVKGDGTAVEAHQGECNGSEGEGKFVSAVARESIMKVDFGNGDAHINAQGEGSDAGKEADKDQYAAKEFGESGEVSAPGGKAEAGNELNVVMETAENFMIAVDKENNTKDEAQDQEREGLQTIEVAQGIPPAERK